MSAMNGMKHGIPAPGAGAATALRARRVRTAVAATLLAVALAVAAALASVVPGSVPAAHAAGAQVSATPEGGTLNPDGATTVDLKGSGFQSVQNGFGGIYVLFGWVSDPDGGSWKPSQGGVTGENYKYVPDDENNPAGYDVFVAFPGSSTEGAANGGEIAADGTWSAKITVPGAKFTSTDRAGNPSDVDCTAVQCGIITIGAHGVSNANNETFTPMTFGASQAASAESDGGQDAQPQQQAESNTGASESKGASQSAEGAGAGSAGTDADTQAAVRQAVQAALEGANVGTSMPSLGVAGWLLVTAVIVLGVAVIVLAAGFGGYLAAKSLLLGVSPEAMEKEMARRERRAEDRRYREQLKSVKRQRKQYRRLAKEQAKTDRVRGGASASMPDAYGTSHATLAAGAGAGSASSGARAIDGDGVSATQAFGAAPVTNPFVAATRAAQSAVTPAEGLAARSDAEQTDVARSDVERPGAEQTAATVAMPVPAAAADTAGAARAGDVRVDGARAGMMRRAADIRGFFTRHAAAEQDAAASGGTATGTAATNEGGVR